MPTQWESTDDGIDRGSLPGIAEMANTRGTGNPWRSPPSGNRASQSDVHRRCAPRNTRTGGSAQASKPHIHALENPMTALKSTIAWAHGHALWLALAALPLIVAACNKSGGGSGY
jgi:hypothetical protein